MDVVDAVRPAWSGPVRSAARTPTWLVLVVLDPDRWRAGLYVGPEGTPPTYDARSGAVPQALVSSSVVEGTWTSLDLPPGRYRLWTTNGGDVAVASCSPGVLSEPVPAAPTPPAARD